MTRLSHSLHNAILSAAEGQDNLHATIKLYIQPIFINSAIVCGFQPVKRDIFNDVMMLQSAFNFHLKTCQLHGSWFTLCLSANRRDLKTLLFDSVYGHQDTEYGWTL